MIVLKNEDFTNHPLVCIMDGALILWKILQQVFSDITNKVLILDIIHLVEYLWKVSNSKYKEGSEKGNSMYMRN
jgi:hypothetical protein